ncbi:MAG TPA: hypothetical protein VG675_17710 [Bryobacteraceae bacterium]|nr:hypothetical protein [Bryobacteraceae bacterium]
MERMEIVILFAHTDHDAREALFHLKGTHRAGWIDVTCYALVEKTSDGKILVHDTNISSEANFPGNTPETAILSIFDSESEMTRSYATPSVLNRTISGAPPQPARGKRVFLQGLLQPGESALSLVLRRPYAERVVEELKPWGHLYRAALDRSQTVTALRASADEMAVRVRWLENLLRSELERARHAAHPERNHIQAAVAGARAELGLQREMLHGVLRDLLSELRVQFRCYKRSARNQGNGDLENLSRIAASIAACRSDLVFSILDHMDWCADCISDLQTTISATSADAAVSLEGQLHELDVRMRANRATLTEVVYSIASKVRHCINQIHANAARENQTKVNSPRRAELETRFALLQSDFRRLEQGTVQTQHQLSASLRDSWRALCKSLDQLQHRHS